MHMAATSWTLEGPQPGPARPSSAQLKLTFVGCDFNYIFAMRLWSLAGALHGPFFVVGERAVSWAALCRLRRGSTRTAPLASLWRSLSSLTSSTGGLAHGDWGLAHGDGLAAASDVVSCGLLHNVRMHSVQAGQGTD